MVQPSDLYFYYWGTDYSGFSFTVCVLCVTICFPYLHKKEYLRIKVSEIHFDIIPFKGDLRFYRLRSQFSIQACSQFQSHLQV